jgi:phosphoribosylformylglycinamidine (FGAM) synthase-like amidotransferase family enzyme
MVVTPADDATLDRLEQNGQVVFRYVNAAGELDPRTIRTAPCAALPASSTNAAT